MASNLLSSEFLSALKTLSKPIEALIPAGLLVVFLVSPALQGFGTQPYLGHRILLFVIAITAGRLFKVGNEDPIRKAYAAVVSLTTGTEYVPAFRTLSKLIGPYFKVAFFTALACYTLQISSVSIPYTPHVFELTLAATVVLGLIAPTKAFYGPLRLGYLQHSTFFFQTYEIFLNWWLGAALLSFLFPILSSSLFPFIALTILGVFAAAWFYVYQEYRKKLQDVVRQSAESTSRAALAADYAREYANSARQYERQMLEVLAATRRDVLLANSVKLTDFFDVAVESWAALERVTNPFSEVTKKVEEIIDAAYEVEDLEKPTRGGNKEEDYDDEGDDDTEKPSDDDDDDDDEEGDDNGLSELAEELVDTAKGAIKAVKQVDSKLRIARRAVLTSREAKNQTTKARNQAVTNAKGATSTTDNLLREVAGILENCFNASQGAENARGYAEKAVAAATLGEMQDAANLAASAKSAADNVVKIKDALKTTRDKARECLVGALRTLSA